MSLTATMGITATTSRNAQGRCMCFMWVVANVFLMMVVSGFLLHYSTNRYGPNSNNQVVIQPVSTLNKEKIKIEDLGFDREMIERLSQDRSLGSLDRLLLGNTRLKKAFEPIWCAKDLLKELQKHEKEFDPALYNMLWYSMSSMTAANQRMHIYRPILDESSNRLYNSESWRL